MKATRSWYLQKLTCFILFQENLGFLGRKFSLEYAPAALLDADFGPLGRNQHPARRGKILFGCHPDVRLRVK